MKTSLSVLASLVALQSALAYSVGFGKFQPKQFSGHRLTCTDRSQVQLQMKEGPRTGVIKVQRRTVLAWAALPVLGVRTASAATSAEAEEIARLQAEAARIQEIFDVQKELNSNLPSLKDGLKAKSKYDGDTEGTKTAQAPNNNYDALPVDKKNLVSVIDTMMKALKTEGENGMRTVLAYSSPENPVKNMPFQNVINSMRDGKYALLFGKFTSYEIKRPEDAAIDDEAGRTHSSVDVIVKAPYNVMLENGMQFEDLKLAKATDNDKKICSATFRWIMRHEADGKWSSEGCYVVPVADL